MLLRTLTFSGLKANRGTFIGLTLLVALMAATLTFSLCIYTDLNERQAQALEDVGAGDVFVSCSVAEVPDSFIAEVERLDKVDHVKVTESLVASTSYRNAEGEPLGTENALNVSYQPWSEALSFNVFQEGTNGSLAVVPHAEADAPKTGEVYVPIGTQPTLGLSLGAEVIVTVGDATHRLTVARFIEEPQLGSPFVEMGQYLVSDDEFRQMRDEIVPMEAIPSGLLLQAEAGAAYPTRTLNIFMTDDARSSGLTSSQFAAYIDENADTSGLSSGFLSAEALTGYAMLVITIFCALFLVFAFFMYIIALVICIHTVSSAIQENYVNFAILKAVGVSNGAIRRSFVLQYVFCATLGCLVGLIGGFLLVEPVLPIFAQLTGVLARPSAPGALNYAALVILLAAIALVVFAKTRKVARISPLSALRSGIEDVHFSSRATVSAAGRPLGLRLAWRALTSAKRSYVSLFACALLLASFVMMTFGIGGALRTMDDSYRAFGIWQSDLSVKLSDGVTIDEVKEALAEVSPCTLVWQEGFTMQSVEGESRSIVGLSDFSVSNGIAEGRAPAHDNEVVIGYKLADDMGLSIGDELVLPHSDGTNHPYLISGLLSAMFNAGYGILMTYDGLENMRDETDLFAESYQMRLADPSQADAARALLSERFGDAVDTTYTGTFSSTQDLMVLIHDLFIVVGYGMDALAVLLAFLAVSLIIRRMFTMERRDLGIYRALGFTARRLRLQFALRFLLVSLLGCIVAAVLVCLGGSWLASQLFGTFGVTKFAIDTSPALIVGCAVGLVAVFFLAAFWSARKVRTISTSILITD